MLSQWMQITIHGACLLLLGGGGCAWAAPLTNALSTEVPSSYTLTQARQIAFERNWDLLAAQANINAAQAQQIIAKEFPNPTASLTTARLDLGNGQNGTPQGNGIGDRNYDTILAFNQLFEIGGKRKNRQTSALAGYRSARASFLDSKRTLDQGLATAYIAVLLADENVQILTASAESMKKQAEISARRLQAGDISDSDKKQIELAAANFELQAATAATLATNSRVAVELLMGVKNPAGRWSPADDLKSLATVAVDTRAAESTVISRADLVAAEEAYRKSDADVKLQKALRVPDPTFQLQVEHNPPGPAPAPDTFGFGVSFPLPLWNRNGGAIKAAEAARTQAAIQVEKTRMQIASDIITARQSYLEATVRSKRYEDELLAKSHSVVESVSFAYQKGGATLVDLLTAQLNDNTTRQGAAQARSDAATAAAALTAAQQVLNPSDLRADR
jgi:cobalt-zinc-cadmium efflux system outer membrane protein